MKKCLVIDCHDPVDYRSMCPRHIQRWRAYGAPDALVVKHPVHSAATIQAVRDAIAAGLTQRAIAKRCGVSSGYVAYLKRTPDPNTLPCDLKGCTVQRVPGYLYCAAHRAPTVPYYGRTKDPEKCIARGCQQLKDSRKQRNMCWRCYIRWRRTGSPYIIRPRGNPAPIKKLTDDQVRAIRHAFANGATARQLAQQFPVSVDHVYNLVERRSRKDVV